MLTGHIPELMIVLVLALIVFGPKRLPEIGGSMGKSIRDFKRGLSHVDDEVNIEHHLASDSPAPAGAPAVATVESAEPVPAHSPTLPAL